MKPEDMKIAVVIAWALIWSVIAVSLVSSVRQLDPGGWVGRAAAAHDVADVASGCADRIRKHPRGAQVVPILGLPRNAGCTPVEPAHHESVITSAIARREASIVVASAGAPVDPFTPVGSHQPCRSDHYTTESSFSAWKKGNRTSAGSSFRIPRRRSHSAAPSSLRVTASPPPRASASRWT